MAVDATERLRQKPVSMVVPLHIEAGNRMRVEFQTAHPSGHIGSGSIDELISIFRHREGRILRNPQHVKNAVAKAHDWRVKPRQPMPGEKSAIAVPSPADALCQNVAALPLSA